MLIFNQIKFHFTHDISKLLKTLKENGIQYPPYFDDSVILTDYAVESRYPIVPEAASEEQLKEALYFADQIYNWVESEIDRQLKLKL